MSVKKLMTGMLTGLVLFGASTSMAVYMGGNITIEDNDNQPSSGSWYTAGHEDQEVEPYAATGQMYDMEAFFLDEEKLTIVSGYNFWSPPYNMLPGDLFVAIGDPSTVLYGDPIQNTTDNGTAIPNSFGWDYVFDMNFTAMTYSLYAINGQSLVSTINTDGMGESNPWRYASGGQFITSGTFDRSWAGTLTDAQVGNGLLGGAHYGVSLDLSVLNLAPETEVTVHWTEQCGNDNIMGNGTTPPNELPDGGSSVLLLGMALIGISRLRAMIRK